MSDVAQSIIDAAATPKTVQSEQGRVEQHSLAEQIEADKYRRKVAAAGATGGPFSFLQRARIVFGGQP